MKVINSIQELQSELSNYKKKQQSVGFVPTMGALHDGHASLMKKSSAENGVTVASIFVNPTQFNDQNDLLKYPRTLEADCVLLEACGVDIVFAPEVSEMYMINFYLKFINFFIF